MSFHKTPEIAGRANPVVSAHQQPVIPAQALALAQIPFGVMEAKSSAPAAAQ